MDYFVFHSCFSFHLNLNISIIELTFDVVTICVAPPGPKFLKPLVIGSR